MSAAQALSSDAFAPLAMHSDRAGDEDSDANNADSGANNEAGNGDDSHRAGVF